MTTLTRDLVKEIRRTPSKFKAKEIAALAASWLALTGHPGEPHLFQKNPNDSYCDECGLVKGNAKHITSQPEVHQATENPQRPLKFNSDNTRTEILEILAADICASGTDAVKQKLVANSGKNDDDITIVSWKPAGALSSAEQIVLLIEVQYKEEVKVEEPGVLQQLESSSC